MSDTLRDIDTDHEPHDWTMLSNAIVHDDSLDGGDCVLAVRWICHCGALKTTHYTMIPSDRETAIEQGRVARAIIEGGDEEDEHD